MEMITTFPTVNEFDRAIRIIENNKITHKIIDPSPGFSLIGIPAIVLDEDIYRAFISGHSGEFICSGWVEYRQYQTEVPHSGPQIFSEDLFGTFSLLSLAPCVADEKKLRITCRFSGDVSKALPYLNTEMPQGMYVHDGPIFSYMDGYHMISIYQNKINIAKTDDIIDTWSKLEKIRCLINGSWSRRNSIEPSYEMRRKPPALEIFKRLPGTSCEECGEKTCIAFALRLWNGEVRPEKCKPIFGGDYAHLRAALLDICSGLGIKAEL